MIGNFCSQFLRFRKLMKSLLLILVLGTQTFAFQRSRKLLAEDQTAGTFLLIKLLDVDCQSSDFAGIRNFREKWDEILTCDRCVDVKQLVDCETYPQFEVFVPHSRIESNRVQEVINTLVFNKGCIYRYFEEYGEMQISIVMKSSTQEESFIIPSEQVQAIKHDPLFYPMLPACDLLPPLPSSPPVTGPDTEQSPSGSQPEVEPSDENFLGTSPSLGQEGQPPDFNPESSFLSPDLSSQSPSPSGLTPDAYSPDESGNGKETKNKLQLNGNNQQQDNDDDDGGSKSNIQQVWIAFLACAVVVIAGVVLVLAIIRRRQGILMDVENPPAQASAGRQAAYLARAEQYGFVPALR